MAEVLRQHKASGTLRRSSTVCNQEPGQGGFSHRYTPWIFTKIAESSKGRSEKGEIPMLRSFTFVAIWSLTFLLPPREASATVAQQSAGSSQGSASLPIRQGYYAQGRDTCASAMADFTLGMFVRPGRFEHSDVYQEIIRTARRPSGEYDVTARLKGEGGQTTQKFVLRILSPSSFSLTSSDREYPKSKPTTVIHRFCSATPPADWNF